MVMTSLIKAFCAGITVIMFSACSTSEPSVKRPTDFTGNEITYSLISGSEFNISGTVVLKEQADGFTTIEISLNGMDGTEGLEFPVHLHYGNVSTDNAEVVALLNPVDGNTWKSSTVLEYLADETIMKFSDLKDIDACIKIHLAATGASKDVILSAGNIGTAIDSPDSSGKFKVGICKSE